MSKRPALFGCAECPNRGKVFKLDNNSVDSLNLHYQNCHSGISAFRCGVCSIQFEHKTSMIRHITVHHVDMDGGDEGGARDNVRNMGTPLFAESSQDGTENLQDSSYTSEDEGKISIHESEEDCNPYPSRDNCAVAAEIVMELRSTARLTGVAIERFQDGYRKLLSAHSNTIKNRMFSSLKAKGMSQQDIVDLIDEVVKIEDPFSELTTLEKQLNFYETNYGLVKPHELFLDSRIDNRLDPKSNEYVPTQVNESFQYIPLIQSLKLILSNQTNRSNIFKDVASKDGVLRSYVDGSEFKNNPFLTKHENVLLLCLFYDELEIAAALGSKTIIHKLGVFFFQILNGPAHLKSKLSSIHLLALVYAEDMKKKGAFRKVLFKFVQEMKRLGSEKGVKIEINGVEHILQAVLVAVSADTLAAHDLLGFLSPSAKHFCRMCMISRPLFRLDGNIEAPLRTRESHDIQVEEVKQQPQLSSEYGVKGECYLNQLPYFHCVDGSVFDAFHDLLEGVVPAVLKMVLRNFIYIREVMTLVEFNTRVASFPYGIPDAKNKPSPNFVMEMLTGHKKPKQTGTQMWCLMRAFPFLVADCVPEGDDHLEIIFTLQNIMKVVFSFEVTHQDLTVLDNLIFRLIEMYKSLFVDAPDPNQEEEDNMEEGFLDDPGVPVDEDAGENHSFEEVESAEDPRRKNKKPLKVHLFNKLHHLKHYVDLIKNKGPIVKLWCAKFEASLKIFRQYASICCNFRNPPKTMAQMFQLSHLWSLITSHEEEEALSLEFQPGADMSPQDINHPYLLEAGISEFVVAKKIIVNGEEYRPGLFIAFMESQTEVPQFSLISEIYVVGGSSVYFLLKPWNVNGLSNKYNAYKVSPNEMSAPLLQNFSSLKNFRPIAPWNTHVGEIYLSPRTQVL